MNTDRPGPPEISILIPAYNEEAAVYPVLRELRERLPDAEIVVIDDGSKDGTAREVRREPSVRLLSHTENRGYGAALKTGMRQCRAPVVAWFDADGQHTIEDLVRLMEPVLKGELDANLGSREAGSDQVLARVPGKWLLRWVAQLIARRHVPDLNCGLRVFQTRVIRLYLHLLPDGFSASATSTLLMIRRGYRVRFTPIRSKARVGTSTVRLRDGISTFALILRIMLLFGAFRLFTSLALLQMIPAVIYSIWVVLREGLGVPALGVVVFLSGCMTFFMGILSAQINEIRQELFELRADSD